MVNATLEWKRIDISIAAIFFFLFVKKANLDSKENNKTKRRISIEPQQQQQHQQNKNNNYNDKRSEKTRVGESCIGGLAECSFLIVIVFIAAVGFNYVSASLVVK